MTVKVKICGITNIPDALAAIEAGADALGFVFCPSPRQVTPTDAAEITRALPPFASLVGLFVNAPPEVILKTVGQSGIGTLQLHGDESPEFCHSFALRVIKAFRIRDEASLATLAGYRTAAWLLDSYVPGKLGGTGERFNWELAAPAARTNGRIILAGGLTPDNVADAVHQVRPYAVDVSSGVEAAPGKKDHHKLRDFVQAAKGAGSMSLT